MKDILIVSATQMDEATFHRSSKLGLSLKKISFDKRISSEITYNNCGGNIKGLGEVYNKYLTDAYKDMILLFVHDDIYIDDFFLFYRLNEAITAYNIVGLAGGKNPDLNIPTWGFKQEGTVISGAVAHANESVKEHVTLYGETPTECKLMDGCFIAVDAFKVINAEAKFDPQFNFHFYDLDFCRTCTQKGLSLGTWPIAVTHSGLGLYGSPPWEAMKNKYFQKWGTA